MACLDLSQYTANIFFRGSGLLHVHVEADTLRARVMFGVNSEQAVVTKVAVTLAMQ